MFGIAGLLLGIGPGFAAAWDVQVAPGAWSLEAFGTDVVVLRSAPMRPRSGDVSFLLACSAADRRMRVSLPPDRMAKAAGSGAGGSILITAVSHGRTQGGAVMRFKLAAPSTLVGDGSGTRLDDPVMHLASTLAAGAQDLDLLLSWGPSPPLLTKLDVYRLSMRGAAPQEDDVAHFIAACRRTTSSAGPLTK
ncbi:hypothetical protein P7D22_11130 [Lichenihabitans sp. Uapishka_5]|uniref:hypothetical protein n=1 Tax=Lichenihabitans sp. Uapishka_5 TaxID=3037302 RepID=UPI0029E7DE41|nr:hypothetical protein [Lichenihabitans sp. Uapishka_5]MDX7951720.1 hypothetical protein [Lichenihabitans sp. Uapishka_5]